MNLILIVKDEFSSNFHMIKEIVKFHVQEINKFYKTRSKKSQLKKSMKVQTEYQDWKFYAQQYDNLEDVQEWKNNNVSDEYDYQYIQFLLQSLREARQNNQIYTVIHIIRSNYYREMAGIMNPELYKKCYLGTKVLIEEFREEVKICFKFIAEYNSSKKNGLSLENKLNFFAETRHSIGRSALLFSGGASMGLYHVGVLKCLYEKSMLPRIISGSSAGSLIAALVCTTKYQDMPKIYEKGSLNWDAYKSKEKNSIKTRFIKLITEQSMIDLDIVKQWLIDNFSDITFLEAYEKTGFILNITVTGLKAVDGQRLLNYLTAPNVIIWSACIASCCIPALFGSTEIYCKNEEGETVNWIQNRRWIDGSIENDLPKQRLAELFNVNNFIVSQTNPYVIPFFSQKDRPSNSNFIQKWIHELKEKVKIVIHTEFLHRTSQICELNLVPTFIQRVLKTFNQNYTGNITIYPVPLLKDYMDILDNPSEEKMIKFLPLGLKTVYPKLNHIEALLEVEQSLEYYYYKLRQENNQSKYIYKGEDMSQIQAIKELQSESDQEELEQIQKQLKKRKSFVMSRNNSSNQILIHLQKSFDNLSKLDESH